MSTGNRRLPLTGPAGSVSRRRFLVGSSAFGAALLAGCAGEQTVVGVTSDQFGELRMRNWTDYIDPDLIPVIEQDLQIPLDYQESYESPLLERRI